MCAAFALAPCRVSNAWHSAQEQANLTKALYCIEILENKPDLAADIKLEILREQCFAETYIQQSPHLIDGRYAVLALFKNHFRKRPSPTITIKRTASEGSLVWVHQHVKHSPEDLSRAVVNILHMEQEK